MAFESVDVSSLKSAISSCNSSIKYDDSLELISSVGNDNVWNCESRDHLKKALVKLTEIRYKELKSKLNVASQVADLIAQYKELEEKNKKNEAQISSLEPNLYYTERYAAGYYEDSQGRTRTRWETRTVKDEEVEREIDRLKEDIRKNKELMAEIEAKVAALIGGM